MNSETEMFDVVINAQGQYSVWPQGKHMAIGWRAIGAGGQRQACLDYIDAHWIDMRPRSLRDTGHRRPSRGVGQ